MMAALPESGIFSDCVGRPGLPEAERGGADFYPTFLCTFFCMCPRSTVDRQQNVFPMPSDDFGTI